MPRKAQKPTAPLEVQQTPIADLKPYPGNPRRGDVEALRESLRVNGQYKPIVISRDGYVLAGNHTLAAASAEGWTDLAAVRADVMHDSPPARRIVAADNRYSERGSQDPGDLLALLDGLDLAGTGYDSSDLDELLANIAPDEGRTDPDFIPERPPARTQMGDLWLMGDHRLLCGDATVIGDVGRLMDGHTAAMVFTDPPYGVSYTGGTAERLTIANDDLSATKLGELLEASFRIMNGLLKPGGAFYVCGPSGRLETTFRLALAAAGLQLRQQIVWIKNRFILGHSDYHLQHETILYGWHLPGEPMAPPHFEPEHETMLYGWADGAAHTWEGGRKQSSVWEYPAPTRSADHPTMKPVAIVRRAVDNSSHRGGAVLDLFAGAGSTLIAAHQSGRRAYLMEIDPVYCDTIVARWEAFTRQKARRVQA